MIRKYQSLLAGAVLIAVLAAAPLPVPAQGKTITVAVPGIPPIFSAVVNYVAEKQGFFKKNGVDVAIRPFDNGTAAARAVIAGNIDLAWAPTPPVINQISNAGVPLVAIYGMPNPDWVLATTESGKSCKDIVGQDVGVDSIGGARAVALRSMLTGCPGVKLSDVRQVALSSSTSLAMIAGRLSFGVLHLDEVAVVKDQGKKLYTLLAMKNTNPTSHYLMLVARRDSLARNREAIVRTVAGMIEAARFMQDPKNADAVADAASVTGHSKAISKAATKEFLAIGFWATRDDGLPRSKLEATAALMKKIGAIKPGRQPVSFEQLVDASVWKDADAMVK